METLLTELTRFEPAREDLNRLHFIFYNTFYTFKFLLSFVFKIPTYSLKVLIISIFLFSNDLLFFIIVCELHVHFDWLPHSCSTTINNGFRTYIKWCRDLSRLPGSGVCSSRTQLPYHKIHKIQKFETHTFNILVLCVDMENFRRSQQA